MANSNDIVKRIVTDTNTSSIEATKWLNAVVAALTELLATDGSVDVPGLGTFSVTWTGTGREPEGRTDQGGRPGIRQEESRPSEALINFFGDRALQNRIKLPSL